MTARERGPTVTLPDATRVPAGLDDVADAVAEGFDRTVEELVALSRIPSVSAAGHDRAAVRRSAERTARLLEDAGLEGVELLEVGDAHPYVTGHWLHAGPDAPTVLLYAHHDVQPVGTPDRWSSEPFEPTERAGRLYGRGTADDKAGVLAHVAAIRAWLQTRGRLPVNVKVVVEGEEEIGSPHLQRFLDRYAGQLDADVIVLADCMNWKVGWPGLTWSLRGLMDGTVTVKVMQQPVHSGMWGGVVPDALTAMSRLLASLHDEAGRIAVKGFADDVRPLSDDERDRLARLDVDVEELRRDARTVPGLELTGDPDRSVLERMWLLPTITPTGMDVPDVVHASNTLLSEVRTKLSCRLAPGQDPQRAAEALQAHLQAHAPFGCQVTWELGETAPAWVTDPSGPAWDAGAAAFGAGYGHEVAAMGTGGSIPFVGPFAEAMGGAACLLIGVEDPATNAHGEDESLHLEDFHKACLSEAFLFHELAERAGAVRRG
jgi:acetylornithine deacetylase/succinyl-diaminopimelate desuccinylase-like protein